MGDLTYLPLIETCLAKERQAHADDIAGVRAGANVAPAVHLRLRISKNNFLHYQQSFISPAFYL